MNLDVSRKTISEVLSLLRKGEWQVPRFQREYVWTPSQARELLQSIFYGYPIGMVTTWAQPQNSPHTPPEPLKIGSRNIVEFKDGDTNPALIKLVLDGKQRLTTLAIGFGGLRSTDGRDQFSGRWFLNFCENPKESDNFIVYKKKGEVDKEGLSATSKCIADGLLPLDKYADFSKITQQIYNSNYYPEGSFPDNEELEKRAENLSVYLDTFAGFQIPFAELPSKVGLEEVCEIFEVLNTTGTKVSTFDLMHNTMWGDTSGSFDLRDKFNTIASSSDSISLLFDESRPEFVCQTVTGMYLAAGNAKKRNGKDFITSIKGGDLLATPTYFYEKVFENISLLNSFSNSFFNEILKGKFSLKELPYPASSIIYFSLRWRLEMATLEQDYSVSELNAFFKAFYWRNILASRYDQGFLTKFADDLNSINESLIDLVKYRGTTSWSDKAKEKLDSIFGSTYPERDLSQIQITLSDPDLRGAIRQSIALFLNSNAKYDLVSGGELDRFSADRERKVDLHHIYPRQWCKDNSAHFGFQEGNGKAVNCFANLVPLSSKSNGDYWRSKSPRTAVKQLQKDWDDLRDQFEMAFINKECFDILIQENPTPNLFWEKRAALIASKIYALQTPQNV